LVFALVFAACDNGSTPPAAPSLDSIRIDIWPTKINYTLGEGFSSTGLRVNAVYSDGSNTQISSGWTLTWNGAPLEEGSAVITGSAGNKTVFVAYGDKTASFTISVGSLDSVYTISGTITTSDGASPLGAAAQLRQNGAPVGSAVSAGANGAYTITGVPAGTYTIGVSLAGYVIGTITDFAVSGANITGKNLVLQKISSGDTTPPAEVTDLIGTPGDGTVTLTWTDPADGDLDHIEISWTGGSVTAEKSTAANRANSKTVAGLTNDTTYAFTVKAVDTSGNANLGETAIATPDDTTPPAEITGLTASAGIEAVTLAWIDPTDDDLDHIEISWIGGSATAEKSMAVDRANSKTIIDLDGGTAYTFTVKAVDISGNVSHGETATATPIDIGTNITIASAEDWANARIQISTGGNGTSSDPKVYILDIQGDVSVPGAGSSENTISGNYQIVRLTGNGTLSLSSSGSIFRLGNSNQTLVIDGPTLTGRANNNAALVYAGDGMVELKNGTISGNTSSSSLSYGGGVYVDNGIFTMSGGNISGNTAYSTDYSYGGGVCVMTGTFTMSGGSINGNAASSLSASYGGGVCVMTGTFTMSGGSISGNAASSLSSGGGGVCVITGTFTMLEGAIYDNTARNGGGLYVGVSGVFTMSGGSISSNAASYSFYSSNGGGVSVYGTFTMSGGAINDNTAWSGGGVYFGNGTFTMSGGSINGNTADNGGGGVFVLSGTFAMSGGSISGNTADTGGGGVSVFSGTFFTKTGGTIYGDTDSTVGNGNATDNTAISTDGHSVHYVVVDHGDYDYYYYYYYCNETLADDANGNISTTDALPAESGDVLNNWTKR
jgi:chitodextrinase